MSKPTNQQTATGTFRSRRTSNHVDMMKQTAKISVELEFDDPEVLEIYETIAKLKGISIGRLAALQMQGDLSLYADSGGLIGAWIDKKLKSNPVLSGQGADFYG